MLASVQVLIAMHKIGEGSDSHISDPVFQALFSCKLILPLNGFLKSVVTYFASSREFLQIYSEHYIQTGKQSLQYYKCKEEFAILQIVLIKVG